MKRILCCLILLTLSFNLLAAKDRISTVVLKASETGKRIVIDAGMDVGLEVGDFAKFYKGKETIAQGKCIKADSSKSIWSVTRLNESERIVANAEINLRTIPSMRTKHVEHIVSISTNGLGLAYEINKYTWNKDTSGVTGNDSSSLGLKANYNYVFKNRMMVGFGLEYERETETRKTDADETETKSTTSQIEVGIGYNFNAQIHDSWWTKISLGMGTISTEETGSDNSNINASYFALELGKRFSLDSIKLVNLSYAPSIEFNSVTYGRDADDAGLDSSTGFIFNIIKFDLLF